MALLKAIGVICLVYFVAAPLVIPSSILQESGLPFISDPSYPIPSLGEITYVWIPAQTATELSMSITPQKDHYSTGEVVTVSGYLSRIGGPPLTMAGRTITLTVECSAGGFPATVWTGTTTTAGSVDQASWQFSRALPSCPISMAPLQLGFDYYKYDFRVQFISPSPTILASASKSLQIYVYRPAPPPVTTTTSEQTSYAPTTSTQQTSQTQTTTSQAYTTSPRTATTTKKTTTTPRTTTRTSPTIVTTTLTSARTTITSGGQVTTESGITTITTTVTAEQPTFDISEWLLGTTWKVPNWIILVIIMVAVCIIIWKLVLPRLKKKRKGEL